jgi:uncharacterized Zn finger protein
MARYKKYSRYDSYYKYESVADKKAKIQRKLDKLNSNNKSVLNPIVIEGRSISNSWWGKAWCKNLERYSDYSNRIGRGRSYVKNGFVIDLKLSRGKIESQVMGSGSKPYKCVIDISIISKSVWKTIKDKIGSKFDSLQVLLAGKFPTELQDIFSSLDYGFFPKPKEIKMDCSCPDWATMCKHIAATLYAVGVRLDESPELIFILRGVDMKDLIDETIKSHSNSLIKKAKNVKSARIMKIKEQPLGELFNIDFKS